MGRFHWDSWVLLFFVLFCLEGTCRKFKKETCKNVGQPFLCTPTDAVLNCYSTSVFITTTRICRRSQQTFAANNYRSRSQAEIHLTILQICKLRGLPNRFSILGCLWSTFSLVVVLFSRWTRREKKNQPPDLSWKQHHILFFPLSLSLFFFQLFIFK